MISAQSCNQTYTHDVYMKLESGFRPFKKSLLKMESLGKCFRSINIQTESSEVYLLLTFKTRKAMFNRTKLGSIYED